MQIIRTFALLKKNVSAVVMMKIHLGLDCFANRDASECAFLRAMKSSKRQKWKNAQSQVVVRK